MGWSLGFDSNWQRDIGYGVPAYCDHPGCMAEIDRGLGYVCGGQPYGGEKGCGLFFCGKHQRDTHQRCTKCYHRRATCYRPTPDHPTWLRFKLRDASWMKWRAENPDEVSSIRTQLRAVAAARREIDMKATTQIDALRTCSSVPELDEAGKNQMREKAMCVLAAGSETFGDMSDEWVADRVRMLSRNDLDHEAICCAARDRIMRLSIEAERLRRLIHNPHTNDFLESVRTEAAFQREHWKAAHDAGKTDSDWFWLIGYLAGKALAAIGLVSRADLVLDIKHFRSKALHHIITTAAACLNWHMALTVGNDMRPGIADPSLHQSGRSDV